MEKKLIDLIEKRKELKLMGATGGDSDDVARIKTNDELFKAELEHTLKSNNNWLLFLFIFLILLTIFISAIIWHVQNNKAYVLALLGGGQGIGIAAIIARMTKLYNRKRTSEILLTLYKNALTEDDRQKLLAEIIKVLRAE